MIPTLLWVSSKQCASFHQAELPTYLARAHDVSPSKDILNWWEKNEETLPNWSSAVWKITLKLVLFYNITTGKRHNSMHNSFHWGSPPFLVSFIITMCIQLLLSCIVVSLSKTGAWLKQNRWRFVAKWAAIGCIAKSIMGKIIGRIWKALPAIST